MSSEASGGALRTGTLARTHVDQPGLPRGASSLGREAVVTAQRERLLRAVISVAAEGYARATVAEVVRRARVSRSVFYERFADKETCFLAGCAQGVELMFDRITAGVRTVGHGATAAERAEAALHAYLQFLIDEPEFAACFLVEAFAAGPLAIAQVADVQARFAENERRWHAKARREQSSLPPVPAAVHNAMVGAIHQLVVDQVRAGRTADLLAVEDVAARLHTAIYTGWPT
ncbi:MAG: TetR/AcrR family transcriptional regulator [Pseudonocardiales bacterium]